MSTAIASAAAPGAWGSLSVSGKTVALLLSVSLHAAAAFTFVHGARGVAHPVSAPRNEPVEIAAPDLEVADAPAPSQEILPAQRAEQRPATAVQREAAPLVRAARDSEPAQPDATPAVATAPAALASPVAAAPHFTMTVAATTRIPAEGGAPGALGGTAFALAAGAPVPEGSVDTPARLLAGNSPSYTPEAEAAGVEADVPLEIVVDASGAVVGARVLTHVGYGLDESALRGIRAYRFSPARRAGGALAVRMRWLMRFQLR